jgi:zinc transporter ZupT
MEVSLAAALLLSTLAGLSTTLGSLAAIVVREPGSRFMSLTLGFSARSQVSPRRASAGAQVGAGGAWAETTDDIAEVA